MKHFSFGSKIHPSSKVSNYPIWNYKLSEIFELIFFVFVCMRPPAPQVRYDIQPYLSRIGKTLLNLIHIDGAFIVQVIEAALLFDLQYRAGGYCHVEERGSREIREHCPQLWGSLKLHHNTKCWLCPHPTLSVCQSPMKDTMKSKRSGNGREKNFYFLIFLQSICMTHW